MKDSLDEKSAEKQTIIISAFPACGKTYTFENCKDYSILDSDSSQFSWIYDEAGNKTNERNPNFISDYISHIKDNIGKVNIIFVSSHLDVRKALEEEGILFYTVYPSRGLMFEWIGRMYYRGNDSRFIDNIINGWDKMVGEVDSEPHGISVIRLKSCEYISIEKILFTDELIRQSFTSLVGAASNNSPLRSIIDKKGLVD